MNKYNKIVMVFQITLLFFSTYAFGLSEAFKENIYNPGKLKPIDSILKVKVGEKVPAFTLPSVSGQKISLNQFKGKKHVVISFVPAAWTPVCSDQWPGYNIVKDIFDKNNANTSGDYCRQYPHTFCMDQTDGKAVVSGPFRFLAPWKSGGDVWSASF